MPWYIFALAVPVLYSVTNFLDKFLIDKKLKNPMVMTAVSGIASGILGIAIGLVTGFKFIGFLQIFLIMFAGIILIFYLIPYYQAMKIEDPSRVVPLFGFIPVFTLVLSAIFLKEVLTAKQMVGLLVVVIAGILISAKKVEGKLFSPRKSLWFMLLASLMYGSVGIIFRFAVKDASFWTLVSYEYIGTGIGGLLLLIYKPIRIGILEEKAALKNAAGLITINNTLSILAQMSEAFAVTLIAVPLVNIVEGVQPLIVLVEGILITTWFPKLVKEDISRETITQKLVSIILIFTGLYLVYF